jgi:NAD(P)-dependent dehydrogenase (short-subunit alcohol dehydrogenase family)
MSRVAVVTGGSSGIGRETALALLQKGLRVYELSRHGKSRDGIRHITCDVTDEEAVRAAMAEILDAEGRLDLLISNAGFGISGAVEFTAGRQVRDQMEVNFFGMDNCVRAVLPIMRRQGGGRIVCLSSVAAAIPIPFQAYYSVSKAAISAYCTALYSEVAPFQIEVCAVLPGDIHTGFTGARQKVIEGDDVYGGRIARSVATMEKDELHGMSARTAGAHIARIALKRRVKPQYGLGAKYRLFLVLIRLLPCRLTAWIVGKLYGG